MSIDSRLREGLRAEAAATHVVPERWEDVAHRAARAATRVRRARIALVASAAAVVVMAVLVVQSDHDAHLQPAPTPPSPSQTIGQPPALAGTWTTGTRPVSRVTADLQANNLGQWAGAVFDHGAPTSYAIQIKLADGQLTTNGTYDGVSAGVDDSQSYVASGHIVSFTPQGSDCLARFQWQVRHDVLTLRLLSDTCPDYRGTPDEAYMHKLYTAAPFRRLD